MPNEALIKFADELKAAREAKKITIQQIAARTKIDIKFLQAIDDARFDVMPNLYIRAFIKEYANVVDLNPEEVIVKFDAAVKGKTEEPPVADKNETAPKTVTKVFQAPNESLQPSTQPEEDTRFIKIKVNYITTAALVTVAVILLYVIFFTGSSTKIISQSSIEDSLPLEEKPAFEIDTPKTKTNDFNPHKDSLELTVKTNQRVWVKVVSDKIVRYEGMVDANNTSNYYASSGFRVVVGNAGFVQLALDGKQIDNIGEKGEVRNITITADSVRAYTLLIPAKNETEPQPQN